ncbi:MAG TPA: o-succinylbenzoate synthase, partial [Gaiellaceae bacterium]|nr:o-succinylbenzoate synthase [Gaiellaceae bacterium]
MELTARIATLRLAETFVIAREAQDEAQVLQVELVHGGVSGFGEAAPIDRYGETAGSALAYVEANAGALGDDPFALEEIEARLPAGENAARAALDAALHDLQGKLLGVPVWKLLGLPRTGPPTSWTVWLGDPDDMARRAEKAAARFRRLKLKLGGGDGLDVERVRAVREAHPDIALSVDANAAYGLEDVDVFRQLDELGLLMIEQPLHHQDLVDHAKLQSRLRTDVCLDESIGSAADAAAAIELGACRIVNVKQGRVGGLLEAVRVHDVCEAQGVPVWCGGMLETGIGRATNLAL